MTAQKVCPKPGCPNLQPCPTHPPRSSSSPWGKTRTPHERRAQGQLRRAALQRDGYRCTRCGTVDLSGRTLQVHHQRATDDYRLDHATILCRDCHKAVDHWAR